MTQISLTYTSTNITGDDALEIIDHLVTNSIEPVGTITQDGTELNLLFSTDVSLLDAHQIANRANTLVNEIRTYLLAGINIQTEEQFDLEEERLLQIPHLMTLAEIARKAEISRQRAWALSRKENFPRPAAETSSGPLYTEAAVEGWMANWKRQNGRPKK